MGYRTVGIFVPYPGSKRIKLKSAEKPRYGYSRPTSPDSRLKPIRYGFAPSLQPLLFRPRAPKARQKRSKSRVKHERANDTGTRNFPTFAFASQSSSLSRPRCTVVLSSSSSSSSSSSLQPRKDPLMALAIFDVFRPVAKATSFRPRHGNFLENGSDECPEIRPVRFWSRLKFNFHAARPPVWTGEPWRWKRQYRSGRR